MHTLSIVINKTNTTSKRISFLVLILLALGNTFAQKIDSSNVNKKRIIGLSITYVTCYAGAIVGFNELWYKNSEQTKFHWFDDSKEWNQIDKFGHAYSAFHESRVFTQTYKWAGLSSKKAALYGGLTAFLYQTPIEILDGYSAKWGASKSDLLANTIGALLSSSQFYFFNDYPIQFKYSFFKSKFSKERPDVLGANYTERFLKDYNGQSYWLSTSISTFNKKWKKYDYLGVCVGYGSEEMIFANKTQNKQIGLNHYRQFYLGPDIQFSKIPTNNKFLHSLLFLLDMYKFPFPALEYNKQNKFSIGFY